MRSFTTDRMRGETRDEAAERCFLDNALAAAGDEIIVRYPDADGELNATAYMVTDNDIERVD